jgi:hypothetical protein
LGVHVTLALDDDSERRYALPRGGTRSLLFVFGGKQLGAHANSASGDFIAGSTHPDVSLTFWDGSARDIVTSDASFDVWYGGIIGSGRVLSVS